VCDKGNQQEIKKEENRIQSCSIGNDRKSGYPQCSIGDTQGSNGSGAESGRWSASEELRRPATLQPMTEHCVMWKEGEWLERRAGKKEKESRKRKKEKERKKKKERKRKWKKKEKERKRKWKINKKKYFKKVFILQMAKYICPL
jgi:hypothetical protein